MSSVIASPATAIIDVAAAAILDTDGRCLLACRPDGRAYAGYWEFPGGKIEAGEDARAALVRELREELSIEVDDAQPWLTRLYAYPEKTVRLLFFRVRHWHGTPQAREGQELSWQLPAAPTVTPLPVYALGGMRPDLLTTAQQHGAHGIALLSGIW